MGHVVLTIMMTVHIIMDRIKQMQIGVNSLAHFTCLILIVNRSLINPIQAPKIMTIFRFSTTGELVIGTIIIIVSQFLVEIQV